MVNRVLHGQVSTISNRLQATIKSYSLAIYGFGSMGKNIVDALIQQDIPIDFIIDQHKGGGAYQQIPIVSLSQLSHQPTNDVNCLITLNNHYLDLRDIYHDLLKHNFKQIYMLQQLGEITKKITIPNGYWLDLSFNYQKHSQKIEAFKALLSDEKSVKLTNQIVRYRALGNIDDYPEPSLLDEYAPHDIPRYQSPLRVIDCGAFNGIAIEKLMHAGYDIDAFVAFEPDPQNYAQLSSKAFAVNHATCLPLGVWSSTTQLRFSSGANMGSHIDGNGETMIQCVRVDDVLTHFAPNLIKFDVEGAEIEAIKGLEKTIKQYQPNLAISVYHKPEHLFEIALLVSAIQSDYQFYLRVHEHNTFGTVLYCLQEQHTVNAHRPLT